MIRSEDTTYFLNVDLDVFSRCSLEPLAVALGSRVIPLFVGRDGRRHRAHFELSAANHRTVDALIVAFVRLVKSLPRAARAVWNDAYRRDFNVGVQAGYKPRTFEVSLKPETLTLVSSVDARVVLTIYAADLPQLAGGRTTQSRMTPRPVKRPR